MAENSTKDGLDESFMKQLTYQIRLLLFAGDDTTSSRIVFTYHLLSSYPSALARLRAEHTATFGPDPSTAADKLHENPTLLNQCRYIFAVTKEILCFYPPTAPTRSNALGIVLTDRHNNYYPVDYASASVQHAAMHSSPHLWPRATKFFPERFLVQKGHELYPKEGAYRLFATGSRACTGRTLVYNEMRTVLVMRARLFKFEPAYEEWDELQKQNEGIVKKGLRRLGVVRVG